MSHEKEHGKLGWNCGDVLRVRLDLEAQSDMSWLVVNDPIPAGSAILGTGLGKDNRVQQGQQGHTRTTGSWKDKDNRVSRGQQGQV